MAKKVNDYAIEFSEYLSKHYGRSSITPQIYNVEILKFISNLDPVFAFNNITEFLNEAAFIVTNSVTSGNKKPLVKDTSILPIKYNEGLLNKNTPSKIVCDTINKKTKKADYITMCNNFTNDNPETALDGTPMKKDNLITMKINRFKMLESLKPTGNSFTKFFKRIFNIGGYNDKLAAYESCKQSFRELVGDKLSNEDFERAISDDQPFSSTSLIKDSKAKEEQPIREKIEINLEEPKQEKESFKEMNEPQQEIVKGLNK